MPQSKFPKKDFVFICFLWFAAGIACCMAAYAVYGHYHKPKPADITNDWYYNYMDALDRIKDRDKRVDSLTDSLYRAKVEYGQLGIEKNRSEALVKQYSKQYTQAKPKRDTTAMLQNCDSLVDELDHRYIELTISKERQADSINEFYVGILDFKDSTIRDYYLQADTLSKKLLACTAEKEKQKKQIDKLEKKKKGATRLAWIGAGIAAIGIFINSLF